MSREQSFWGYVSIGSDDDCWPWRGGISSNGYGYFSFPGHSIAGAHRVAWEIFNGERLGNRSACHRCDNKLCCNPKHIYAGTVATNARDAKERGLIKETFLPGERHRMAKLSDNDANEIKERASAGETQKSIASRFGVSQGAVSMIVNGKRRRAADAMDRRRG